MWLLNSSHERAAHYWLLLGLALIITGAYLAIEMERSYLYYAAGVGVACCIWSIRIFTRRNIQKPEPYIDVDLDQTCELNYNPEDS